MPARQALPPRKRLAFTLLTAGIGAVLGVTVLEVGARGLAAWRARAPLPPRERLDLLRPNPAGTGSYRNRPSLDLTTRVGGRRVRIRTNRHGMPWREVEPEGDGRRRIAFLGDSFVFGCWADDVEHSLVGVFERNLSVRRWEVLNFGVGGYGFADQELLLRELVASFGPTYVILVSFNGNDFRDTWLGLDKERIVNGTAELDDAVIRARVPASELVEDVAVSAACEPSASRRLLERSTAVRLAAPLLGMENLCLDLAVNRNFTMYTYWSQHPFPEAAQRAAQQSLATLARIDAFLLERGARLAIAAIPTREQVHARRAAGPDFDIAFPQIYLQVFARERGIPYLDLLPDLRDHVRRTNQPLYVAQDTHLNNRGHALVGDLLAEWFRCCVRGQPRPEAFAKPSS
jgi:lysophospholipase L1-like esterase